MKKINNIYILVLMALLSITVCSCEKEIDVDLNSAPPHITIEGEIREGMYSKVRVSHTIDFNNNDGYPIIEDAIVKISDDNGKTEILTLDESGWYIGTDIIGEVNRNYTLLVEYKDAAYTAMSKIPPRVELDSITMHKFSIGDEDSFPEVHFVDPTGEANIYYRCLLSVNGVHYSDIRQQLISAEFTDGGIMHHVIQFDDDKYDIITDGNDISIELQCIDKGTYTFYKTLHNIESSLANPTSNIKGGALGYFSAYSFHHMSITATIN